MLLVGKALRGQASNARVFSYYIPLLFFRMIIVGSLLSHSGPPDPPEPAPAPGKQSSTESQNWFMLTQESLDGQRKLHPITATKMS